MKSTVSHYCVGCHDAESKEGGLDLERLMEVSLSTHAAEWEGVIRKLRARQMPPVGKKRPPDPVYEQIITRLASPLDHAAAKYPNPGRTDSLRRLNRTEYQNAIRDLLGLEIDAVALLPKDDASHGFDNVTVGDLSPTLLNRYLSAAERISRLAVGSSQRRPGGDTFRVRPDLTQEEHIEGGSVADRRAALRKRASLLDSFSEDLSRLKRVLGPQDRDRVAQYLDTVREVERRIQKAEGDAVNTALPDLDRPVGVPASYADHARLMFDLHLLALQGDVTRVITFQLARETSNRTYPEIGIPDPHHPLTHHGNDPDKVAKMAKINQFHVSLFAEFIGKLKATREGGGTLLDHSLFLYGSGMGNPNVHDHKNLPIIVAGGRVAGMKGGRHIRYDKPTPLANLHLTLLDKAGVRLDSFADSRGKVSELFDPLAL